VSVPGILETISVEAGGSYEAGSDDVVGTTVWLGIVYIVAGRGIKFAVDTTTALRTARSLSAADQVLAAIYSQG